MGVFSLSQKYGYQFRPRLQEALKQLDAVSYLIEVEVGGEYWKDSGVDNIQKLCTWAAGLHIRWFVLVASREHQAGGKREVLR